MWFGQEESDTHEVLSLISSHPGMDTDTTTRSQLDSNKQGVRGRGVGAGVSKLSEAVSLPHKPPTERSKEP